MKDIHDAVVVGIGLAGGWAVKELCEGGLNVLALDAGPLLEAHEALANRRRQHPKPEMVNHQRIQSGHPAYWSTPALFIDDIDHPYRSKTDFQWIRGRQIGGRSLTWGGVALRFSDHEFLAPVRDGVGSRWPISFTDLDSWYGRVERFLGVQGTREGIAELPDGEYAESAELTDMELKFKSIVESKWSNRRVISCRGDSTESSRAYRTPDEYAAVCSLLTSRMAKRR